MSAPRTAEPASNDPPAWVEDSPFGVLLVDAQLRLLRASAGARGAFGDAVGRDLGDVLHRVWPAPFVSAALACFRHTLATGEPYRDRAHLARLGGEEPALDWALERREWPGQGPVVLCFFYDLTEHLRVSRALQQSQRRLALLSRLADETRTQTEPAAIVHVALRLLREELRADGCAWADINDDNDHDARVVLLGAVSDRTGAPAFLGPPVLARLRDGQPFVCADARDAAMGTDAVALLAAPLRRGGRLVAAIVVHAAAPRAFSDDEVAVVHEVSARCWESLERARAERALREREGRYRAVVESQGEMLSRFHVDGTLLFVNQAYARGLGSTPEALIGRSFWDFVPEADRPALRDQLVRLTPQTPQLTIENRLETAAGERWLLWTNHALRFDDEGLVLEAQSSGIDITERKRMEEALRRADRLKDEFLAMLGHELRTPLSALRSASQLLLREDSSAAQQRAAAAVIDRQGQHLTRLVDDLLDVARVTEGRLALQRAPVALRAIIDRAVESTAALREARGHRLTLTLPAAPVFIDGDETRLVQVVGNLLHNAAKYSAPGGRITVAATAEAGTVVLRVRDQGVGIPADLLPLVFEPFVQAERSLDRAEGGLGLGLTLVRRLVEAHGGAVEARSEGAGQGSEFIVRLPTTTATGATPATPAPTPAPTPASPPSPPDPAPQAGRALRVLIVEDNEDAAEMLAILLAVGGHEVQTVHDGRLVEGAARAFRPDVILCDLGLPGLDGFQVARALRGASDLASCYLVALSGYGQERDRRRAHESGFDHHFTKPVEPAALDALLDEVAARRGVGRR